MALHGTVKRWDNGRGFGFIKRDDGETDMFVHVSEVRKSSLLEFDRGTRVCFSVAMVKGRPAACDLRSERDVTDGAAVIAQVFRQ